MTVQFYGPDVKKVISNLFLSFLCRHVECWKRELSGLKRDVACKPSIGDIFPEFIKVQDYVVSTIGLPGNRCQYLSFELVT